MTNEYKNNMRYKEYVKSVWEDMSLALDVFTSKRNWNFK